ncbi:hypothetical protein KVT40_003156 [Elsinoe batatas]|uniref:Uncharacterized protein n=1 Tax=Elsinoe batatas TaxID=2601811 RepID=A0A8K0L3K6_9PEZI|nr:hypothetical protein KVT40_003156 [Elsinoe batatas]
MVASYIFLLSTFIPLVVSTCTTFEVTNRTNTVPGPNITISDGFWCGGPRNCSVNTRSTVQGADQYNVSYGGIATDRATLNLTLPANETSQVLQLVQNTTGTLFYTIMQHDMSTMIGVRLTPGQGGWAVFMVDHTCIEGRLGDCDADGPSNGTTLRACTPKSPPQERCWSDSGFPCMEGTITWNFANETESRAKKCESCKDANTTDQTRLVTNTTADDATGGASRHQWTAWASATILGAVMWVTL